MKTKRRRLLVLLVIVIVIMCYSGTALADNETTCDLHHSGYSKTSYPSNAYVHQQYDNHLDCVKGEKDGYYVRCLAVEDVSGYPKVSSTDEIFDNGVGLYVYEHASIARHVKIKIVNYGLGVGYLIYTHGHWDINP